MAPSRVRIPPSPLSAAPAAVLRPPAEGWQSGRMRRARKPLSVVRRIEGSNPSPSALLPEQSALPATADRLAAVMGPRARCQLRLVALAATATATAGCGATSHTPAATSTSAASCAKSQLTLVKPGRLTVGTDNPAYPPWYAGGTKSSFWKINDPSTGKGFESATAYAVAKQLGFSRSAVHWTY